MPIRTTSVLKDKLVDTPDTNKEKINVVTTTSVLLSLPRKGSLTLLSLRYFEVASLIVNTIE